MTKVLTIVKPKRRAKDKGYRSYSMRFRKILDSGFFVRYPLNTQIEVDNEGYVRLWRAVLDEYLKDLIRHHLIGRDFDGYYNAMRFIDQQHTGKGQEVNLAFLNPDETFKTFMKFERLLREMRDKGIVL